MKIKKILITIVMFFTIFSCFNGRHIENVKAIHFEYYGTLEEYMAEQFGTEAKNLVWSGGGDIKDGFVIEVKYNNIKANIPVHENGDYINVNLMEIWYE